MSAETVVLLHGIWMPGAEMLYIKHRLEKEHSFDCHVFGYPSVNAALDENAAALAGFVASLDATRLHFVGHSLGGIVTLRMLATNEGVPAGRVVCLGSPLCGSDAARSLKQHAWGRKLLGQSLPAGAIEEPAEVWAGPVTASREVGVIAGTVPAGMGRLFASFEDDNDGSVAVAETRLPGLKDHLLLRVSHSGMIVSRAVADQTAAFLKRGEFLREEF